MAKEINQNSFIYQKILTKSQTKCQQNKTYATQT